MAKRAVQRIEGLIDDSAFRERPSIQEISDLWVNYPGGTRLLTELQRLYKAPTEVRPSCLLIVGDTNNGKTTVARRFKKEVFRNLSKAEQKAGIQPVIYVQTPPAGSRRMLLTLILRQLNAPFSTSASADRLQLQLLEVLPKARTRMIMVDEVHNVLIARRREQEEYFQLLKFLSNELGLVIVGIGTVEALRAMQTDQQIGNRFEPYRLDRWEANEDFVKFLTGLADAMNIKKTMVFKKKSVLNEVWNMSEGLTGEAKKIVAKAVELTFEEGHETLTPEVFAKIGWVSPGERRMSASRP